MSSQEMLEKLLGGPVFKEPDFIRKTYRILNAAGFNDDNSIAAVVCCRDEISQTLRSIVKHIWGEAFNLSSLAGMFTAGRTSLKAAMHHAPQLDGRERHVYYAMPHIAIDEEGKSGFCKRKGIKTSSACGALCLFLNELNEGKLNLAVDDWDVEESMLKRRLLREIPYGYIPDLLEVTKIARAAIQADLEHTISQVTNLDRADYAVITGIQVHAPEANYIWPCESYVVLGKSRHDMDFLNLQPVVKKG